MMLRLFIFIYQHTNLDLSYRPLLGYHHTLKLLPWYAHITCTCSIIVLPWLAGTENQGARGQCPHFYKFSTGIGFFPYKLILLNLCGPSRPIAKCLPMPLISEPLLYVLSCMIIVHCIPSLVSPTMHDCYVISYDTILHFTYKLVTQPLLDPPCSWWAGYSLLGL